MVVRHALADDLGTIQDARMALVVEGQLPGKAVEEFKGLTVVKCLRIPK
jgi:predicted regulator of amino acid metabolism with ACT domain